VKKIERRPESERTQKNKNIAVLQALNEVSKTLAPKWVADNSLFRKELQRLNIKTSIEIDPHDMVDLSAKPEYIGILVGDLVLANFTEDGFNQVRKV
jgi:hypothetical protein